MSKHSSRGIDIAYKLSEKSGEFWGNVVSSIVNFGAEYVNVTYNCVKIGINSFKKNAEPTVQKVCEKFNDTVYGNDKVVTEENNSSNNEDSSDNEQSNDV